jgi:hypothetical protein
MRCAIVSWSTMMSDAACRSDRSTTTRRRDVDQLRSHAKAFARVNEAGGQHGADAKLLPISRGSLCWPWYRAITDDGRTTSERTRASSVITASASENS